MRALRIGVVGFINRPFAREEAIQKVNQGISAAISDFGCALGVEIVSGLTNTGVPAIAYAIAKANGYKTTGIACEKAREHECFPVDNKTIVGTKWGDESDTFLDYVDVIVRVGGGKQALRETVLFEEWGGRVYAYELDAIALNALS